MLKIYIYNKKNRLFKLADSINDHTIPNDLCLNEIKTINNAKKLFWQLSTTSNNNYQDTGNTAQNIYQFQFTLQYEINPQLANIGLLCITGQKQNIIAKFEFYVQQLTQESINDAIEDVKTFCKKHHFLQRRTKFQIEQLQKYLDTQMYQAIIMIHEATNPYKQIKTIYNYTKIYPKNTNFIIELMTQYIREIMQRENFI